jgi:hypothetical protein
MSKKKSETRKEFDKATGKTKWIIIKLENLPEDCPVLAVNGFANKSFAEFHLTENVLVPESALEAIKIDVARRKPLTKSNKSNKK